MVSRKTRKPAIAGGLFPLYIQSINFREMVGQICLAIFALECVG
jgi:hypothetical protein